MIGHVKYQTEILLNGKRPKCPPKSDVHLIDSNKGSKERQEPTLPRSLSYTGVRLERAQCSG